MFALRRIPAHTLLEVSPVLLLPTTDLQHTAHTVLEHYTYTWPVAGGGTTQALALGLGSLFNHSSRRQNVVWRRDVAGLVIRYVTAREVEAGEELCISYGAGRLWFRDVEGVDEDDVWRRLEVGGAEDEFELAGLRALELNVTRSRDGSEDQTAEAKGLETSTMGKLYGKGEDTGAKSR